MIGVCHGTISYSSLMGFIGVTGVGLNLNVSLSHQLSPPTLHLSHTLVYLLLLHLPLTTQSLTLSISLILTMRFFISFSIFLIHSKSPTTYYPSTLYKPKTFTLHSLSFTSHLTFFQSPSPLTNCFNIPFPECTFSSIYSSSSSSS